MSAIEDMKSDKYEYMFNHLDTWILLLYELYEVSMVISVPNANLMSIIQVYDSTTECQNRINQNPRKRITLFGYDKNIQRWLADIMVIPNNLECVNIFCGSDDWFFVTARVENYRRKFKNTVFEIMTFEELNQKLLLHSLKYFRSMRIQFKEDFGILTLLNQDYLEICRALKIHALLRADIEDRRIRDSEEAQQ